MLAHKFQHNRQILTRECALANINNNPRPVEELRPTLKLRLERFEYFTQSNRLIELEAKPLPATFDVD
jgi:hypothetical protein